MIDPVLRKSLGISREVFCVLIALMLLPGAARGAAIKNMTLEEITNRSECVVYGRVLGNRCYWDESTQTIWTQTELQVLDVAKGRTGSVVLVKEPGGILGKVAHIFPGIPRFEVQREVVLFLYSSGANEYRVTGLGQGYFAVRSEASSQTKIAVPAMAGREAVFINDPAPAPPQQQKAGVAQRLDDLLLWVRTAATK